MISSTEIMHPCQLINTTDGNPIGTFRFPRVPVQGDTVTDPDGNRYAVAGVLLHAEVEGLANVVKVMAAPMREWK